METSNILQTFANNQQKSILLDEIDQTAHYRRYSERIAQDIARAQAFHGDGFASILDPQNDKICDLELESKLARLSGCATILELRRNTDPQGNPHIDLHNANFCRQPDACPVCAKRLQRKRVARFREPIKAAAAKYRYCYLVTFTVRNGESLRERLNHLIGSLQRFRKKGQKRGQKRSLGEWGKVRAAMLSIEVKRGRGSGLWHPHAHALVFTRAKLDYAANELLEWDCRLVKSSKISREWVDATCGDSIGVDVRPIRAKGGKWDRRSQEYQESVFSQAMEILKYNSKIISEDSRGNVAWNPFDVATVMLAGYARRKFITYGEFRYKGSPLYCGDLEPYVSQAADGMGWKDSEIYSCRWDGAEYRKPVLEKYPVFENSDIDWRKMKYWTLQARILGQFKSRKYRILRVREWLAKRGKIDVATEMLRKNFLDQGRAMRALKELRQACFEAASRDIRRNIWVDTVKRLEELRIQAQWIPDFLAGLDGPAPLALQ